MTEPWSLYTMDYFGPDGTPQIRLATPKMLFVCHFYDRPSELAFNALLVAEGIRPGAYVSSSGKDDEKWMVLLRQWYPDLRFTKRSERFLVSLGDIETIPADAVAMGAFLGYCYPMNITARCQRGNWYYNITLEPKQPGLGTIPVYNQVVSCYTTALTDSKFTAICELVKELGIPWVVTRKLGEQKSI